MRQINLNVYPKDGYIFRDSDGYVHQATGWKKLALAVADYRARNGFAPGSPWEEIMTQQCAKTPGLCNEQPTTDPTGMTFTQHVIAWLGAMSGRKRSGQWPRVDDQTAARRAAICAECPKQKAISQACGACVQSVKTLRRALLDGQKPLHQNLDACAALNEDCQIAVHIDQPPSTEPNLPAKCWRR